MKRIGLVITIGLTLLLSGCFNIDSIGKDFEKAGYTVSENSSFVSSVVTALSDDDVEVEVYSYTNGKDAVAVVIDFDDEADIATSFETHVFFMSYITAGYEMDELTRDNFVILPITASDATAQEMIDVFQGN